MSGAHATRGGPDLVPIRRGAKEKALLLTKGVGSSAGYENVVIFLAVAAADPFSVRFRLV